MPFLSAWWRLWFTLIFQMQSILSLSKTSYRSQLAFMFILPHLAEQPAEQDLFSAKGGTIHPFYGPILTLMAYQI